MTILTERQAWRKARDPKATRRSSDLTPEEQANVKRAIDFLRRRVGSLPKLAKVMGANVGTVRQAAVKRSKVSAGLALRVARAAGVNVEDVLGGAWPPEGACPYCGR